MGRLWGWCLLCCMSKSQSICCSMCKTWWLPKQPGHLASCSYCGARRGNGFYRSEKFLQSVLTVNLTMCCTVLGGGSSGGPCILPRRCCFSWTRYVLIAGSFTTFKLDLIQCVCFGSWYIFSTSWQLCSGVDENAVGACAQLVFAPIDESFADDAPLLPSGFRVIPLDPKTVCYYI